LDGPTESAQAKGKAAGGNDGEAGLETSESQGVGKDDSKGGNNSTDGGGCEANSKTGSPKQTAKEIRTRTSATTNTFSPSKPKNASKSSKGSPIGHSNNGGVKSKGDGGNKAKHKIASPKHPPRKSRSKILASAKTSPLNGARKTRGMSKENRTKARSSSRPRR
jgi:hypothetical protein